jgi:hypothetical protein
MATHLHAETLQKTIQGSRLKAQGSRLKGQRLEALKYNLGLGGVAKLADARDLGSLGHKPWGFESLRRQTSPLELSARAAWPLI